MAQNRDFDFRLNPDGKSVTLTNFFDKNTQKVVIPSTVNNYPVTGIGIGHAVFYECTGLISVTIPNSVTSIGQSAFAGCSGLISVTIGNSVTSIGAWAFNRCSGLTSVTIGNSVKTIGPSAFAGCTGLTIVNITDITSWCNIIFGSWANPLRWAKKLYLNGNMLENLVIPNSVTRIGPRAFESCSGLTSVTIPDSVTKIGEGAFNGCTGLTSVIIPESVKSIGESAFHGCTGLTSVTIPDSVTNIDNDAFKGTAWFANQPDGLVYAGLVAYKYKGPMPIDTSIVIKDGTKGIASRAFSGCTGLTSVTIPDSVTSIGDWAFHGTAWFDNQPDGLVYAGLVAYKYKGTMPSDTSIVLKDGTKGIAVCAFRGCTGLRSVSIGNSVTSIGDWAFSGCTGLKSVTIPNSVISIGDWTFKDCPSLKQVILTGFGHNCKVLPEKIQNQIEILRIGSGISEIGNLRCNPKEIWCYAEVPPKCSEGVFTGFDAVLHVPQRAAAAYFTADVWRNFTNIVFDADEKLTLSHPSVNMGLLETFQLSATAEHTQESGVVWSSSDPSIATVSEKGVVRAIQPGTCRISATLADNPAVYASCEVKVDNRVIISLDSDTIQMQAMKIHALEPKFYPRAVDVTVTSSDPEVVLPRKDGQRVQLLGLKAGECRVTLSAPDARPVTVTVVVTDTDVVSRE